MKFDMTAAWNEAMRLANANRDVLLVVAGVFFFLPYVAFMLLFRDRMNALEAAQASRPDPEAASAAMMGFYGDIWWVILLIAVIQGIGMLGQYGRQFCRGWIHCITSWSSRDTVSPRPRSVYGNDAAGKQAGAAADLQG